MQIVYRYPASDTHERVTVTYDGINCIVVKVPNGTPDVDILATAQGVLDGIEAAEAEAELLAALLAEEQQLLIELGDGDN